MDLLRALPSLVAALVALVFVVWIATTQRAGDSIFVARTTAGAALVEVAAASSSGHPPRL